MLPVFHHLPGPIDVASGRMAGLDVAVAGFVGALCRHIPGPIPLGPEVEAAPELDAARVIPVGADGIARVGTLQRLDLRIDAALGLRTGDARAFSVVGLTHSLANRPSWQAVADWAALPVQPWDALVCTSAAGRSVIDRLLDAADAARGGDPFPRPERPVIPLGVETTGFAPDPARRTEWRRRLGVAADEVLLLALGRLAVQDKANPLALFLAVAEAARRGARLRLVVAGWVRNARIEAAYHDALERHAGGVPAIVRANIDAEEKRGLLAAADIFVSVADSIQETFGLAPVEAMAAGLPVVASDWNGYRETVRHGADGVLVPTMTPPAGAGADLGRRYQCGALAYQPFALALSQTTTVDIRAAATALAELAAHPDRRRAMGAAGRTRAVAEFDWATVVARHRALWQELAVIRSRAPETRAAAAAAVAVDPYALFAGYPTVRLAPGDRLVPGPEPVAGDDPLLAVPEGTLPPAALVARLAERLASGCTVADLLALAAPEQRPAVFRWVAWTGKRGALAVEPARSLSAARSSGCRY